MKRYAKTQDEMAGLLGISRQQFGKYAKRDDAPSKTGAGYNVAQWSEYVKAVKEVGLSGDGSLRDEKLLREIRKLDVQIDQLQGDLVDRRETESKYRAKLTRYRSIADAWKSHNTAKYPDQAEIIAELWESLCQQMAMDAEEASE